MAMVTGFTGGDLAAVFAMWAAMVLAMMLPTLQPAVAAHAARGHPVLAMLAGYLAVWFAVSALAGLGQIGLIVGGALSPEMAPAGRAFSASVLIAAGLYQFTPLKMACLVRCRNPHRAAIGGGTARAALRIGIAEGLACLGCCWAMMAVMFAAGLMNLAAMAFIGALMALEKRGTGVIYTYGLGAGFLLLGLGLASVSLFG
jgi:predicted metal-binding membrane protein